MELIKLVNHETIKNICLHQIEVVDPINIINNLMDFVYSTMFINLAMYIICKTQNPKAYLIIILNKRCMPDVLNLIYNGFPKKLTKLV